MLGWNLVFASSRAPVSDLVELTFVSSRVRERGVAAPDAGRPARGSGRRSQLCPFPHCFPLCSSRPRAGRPHPGDAGTVQSPRQLPRLQGHPLFLCFTICLFYHQSLGVDPSSLSFLLLNQPVETWTPLSKSGGGPIKLVRQKKKKKTTVRHWKT